jgi:hypothetical protein
MHEQRFIFGLSLRLIEGKAPQYNATGFGALPQQCHSL